MRRLLGVLVAVAILFPLTATSAHAQVLCDPADHCWTKRKERHHVDAGDWRMVKGKITSTITSTADGGSCWHLNIPNIWQEWWLYWRTVITQNVAAHWCWDADQHLTSASTIGSYTMASFTFWTPEGMNLEAKTGNPNGGTWAYERQAAHFSECVTNLVPFCARIKLWTSVTMKPGTAGGEWKVDRGVTT